MADTKKEKAIKEKAAEAMYKLILKRFDAKKLKYTQDKKDLQINISFSGDDLSMDFVVFIDVDRQLVRILSRLPITFPSERRLAGAIVTSQINYRLADGSFDYDSSSGKVYFRITTSFRDSDISEEVIEYLMGCAIHTVDEYNDKLLAIANGRLSLSEYLKTITA